MVEWSRSLVDVFEKTGGAQRDLTIRLRLRVTTPSDDLAISFCSVAIPQGLSRGATIFDSLG